MNKIRNPVRSQRLQELREAQLQENLAKARADLDYVTMITGVEVPIPEDDEQEGGMLHEFPEV